MSNGININHQLLSNTPPNKTEITNKEEQSYFPENHENQKTSDNKDSQKHKDIISKNMLPKKIIKQTEKISLVNKSYKKSFTMVYKDIKRFFLKPYLSSNSKINFLKYIHLHFKINKAFICKNIYKKTVLLIPQIFTHILCAIYQTIFICFKTIFSILKYIFKPIYKPIKQCFNPVDKSIDF